LSDPQQYALKKPSTFVAMNTEHCDVLIIGAGLSGLAIAYYLRDSGLSLKVIEARERIGGRIHTIYKDGKAPLEMGATWLGDKHKQLRKLLADLDIGTFHQVIGSSAIYEAISTSPHYLAQLPPNPEPSHRIAGGSSTLINKLAAYVEDRDLILGEKVKMVTKIDNGETLQIKSQNYQINAKKVVSTLPPNLLASSIAFKPALPANLTSMAKQTHTWMGESIKIALTFKEAFWRTAELSGTVFSNVGPIPEMYDHSNVEDNYFALKGFFSGTYFNVSKEERLSLVLSQLRKYFGSKVDAFIDYEEAVWRNEKLTFTPYQENVLPHQNNGHPIFRSPFLDGRFFVAGTETATIFPGYMEGAVVRAKEIAQEVRS